MALGDTVVWETRTDGHADNGGGYSSGGTDRSQQASPHVTFDGATITASNGGVSATITLAGYTVISGDVGNVVNITGGTNFTTGRYRVASVDTGAGTWTLDRACTTGAGSGMTGRMGGALDLATLPGVGSGAQEAWVRGGTYSRSATLSFPTSGTWDGIRLRGYSTTRGDGGKPILQATAGSIYLLEFDCPHTNCSLYENFELDGNSQSNTDGVRVRAYGGSQGQARNITAHHCRYGFNFVDQGVSCDTCIAYSNSSGWRGYTGSGYIFFRCKAYDNTGAGFDRLQGRYIYCESFSNGGAGYNLYAGQISEFIHCHATLNGAGGWDYGDTSARFTFWVDCIAEQNTGWGFREANSKRAFAQRCATYSNSSGAFSGVTELDSSNITLTGSAFVDASTDDFRLNNTASAGASCRAAGVPSYADIGTYQHADPATNAANLFGGALVR